MEGILEGANAMIKKAVNFKENEMPVFCNKMNTLVFYLLIHDPVIYTTKARLDLDGCFYL